MVLLALPARAELVYFANGRTISIKSHRVEGASLVLTLRAGGEIVCEPSAIARIAPDEVPYPEETPAPAPAPLVAAPAVPYGEIIDKVSAAHGVDAKLVRAVIQVESAYRQRARSRKGAMGLMQLMPETAKQYAVADPYEPESNIEGGIKHLQSLLQRFAQNVPLALAAYNAGEAAVRRFGGIPPYAETREYVSSILQIVGPSSR
ncbi:MAG TPA: lytic transglycosylase domain-containing protein [Vicinamibacterales bacterium]|nr:lytic transglycosylase domain-containing protein [Vicinamibacterales bacterium]